jgi:guanine deaminase
MLVRGPILNPRSDGSVQFIDDGTIGIDSDGRISFVGPWNQSPAATPLTVRASNDVICPAFLDAHTHIPQHPIRGKFLDGVEADPPEGRLMAGLKRNVFPAEARCADPEHARNIVADFLADTLAHGVVGGSAYMTVHMPAARIALEMLPDTWSVGPVLMNMNCPDYLRTDESTLQRDIETLAEDFGRRVIVADRFAMTVDSSLRRRAVDLARSLGLRMQTHLNEQIPEKQFVEQTLYPEAGTYTNVYARDGLLDCQPILAHCVHMSSAEFDLVRSRDGVIAHCPTSNLLLGSGVMPLDLVRRHGIEYAICTDVGASPTVSMLSEMKQFLKVHAGRSKYASPQEALYRSTLEPARILELGHRVGSFDIGKDATFLEIACHLKNRNVDDVITSLLEGEIQQVTVKGKSALRRSDRR